MVKAFTLVFWQWLIKVIWVGSLCQCCGICWFRNGDDGGMFSKMGIVLVLRAMLQMFMRYLMASGPRYLRCLMFMLSGPVKLLLMLFESANCTCVMASCISSIERFLVVWSICLLILFVLYGVMIVNLLLKAFALDVNNSCFSSKVNASALWCQWLFVG